MQPDVTMLLSFGAGLLSFVSPCTLPLYPIFLSYLTGMTIMEMQSNQRAAKRMVILHTIFFLLGFSVIFLAIGYATSFINEFFLTYQKVIRQLGAILIIFFGFMTSGMIHLRFLMRDKKFQFRNRPSGYFGSFLIGLAFAAGWTPCTGPILGSVILLASTNPTMGIWYLLAYYLGFSILFFILSFYLTKLDWLKIHSNQLMKIGGFIMIGVGVLLFFNELSLLTKLVEMFNKF